MLDALKICDKSNQIKKRLKSANKVAMKGITNLKYNLIQSTGG